MCQVWSCHQNAVWDGCRSVSYKWDWMGWDGYLRVGWSIEQLTLLIKYASRHVVGVAQICFDVTLIGTSARGRLWYSNGPTFYLSNSTICPWMILQGGECVPTNCVKGFELRECIPDICHFFYTHTFSGLEILHSKVRKFATKIASRQNSVNQYWRVKFTYIYI